MPRDQMVIGVVTAALTGILAIEVLMAMLRRTGFGVFAVYRVLVAVGALAWWFLHR